MNPICKHVLQANVLQLASFHKRKKHCAGRVGGLTNVSKMRRWSLFDMKSRYIEVAQVEG